MTTVNVYAYPIDMTHVTAVQHDSLAHVGEMRHAIDFDAPEGTPVMAALDGVVVAVKGDSTVGGLTRDFEELGNLVEIQHPRGEVSEYEHLLGGSVCVGVGDRVKKGDIIAAVGNTGWSACPHLHFMVVAGVASSDTREIRFERPRYLT